MSTTSQIQRFASNILNAGTIGMSALRKQDVQITTAAFRDLSRSIASHTFERYRHDIGMWREAVMEAEQGFIQTRYRVKMQRMFYDTILNEHVFACVTKRKRQILLKKFAIVDKADVNTVYGDQTNLLNAPWFTNFLSYVLDSVFFGYNLISLGDLNQNQFSNLSFVPRENISPDRYNVSSYPYLVSGTDFTKQPVSDWHIYVSTPTENGKSPCGYGLFYKIAKTEILLRNNTAYNADFNEMYGQPIRKGKTTKTDETERDTFFKALIDLAHKGAILLDEGADELELVEAKSAGAGWQGFENFEQRLEKKISKVTLGHADAMDSTPGKLGSGQDGEYSAVNQALDEIESEDTKLCENVVNNELLPRMRRLGFQIPEQFRFTFLNDKEKLRIRQQEDVCNKATADVAVSMSQAGFQMDMTYFEERTGIKTVMVPKPEPLKLDKLPTDVKNKLEKIYNRK